MFKEKEIQAYRAIGAPQELYAKVMESQPTRRLRLMPMVSSLAACLVLVVVLGLPLIVAGIVILVLNGKMKSVAKATKASAYITGELELRRREDRFTHSTQVKTKIESSSSGGGKSRSSGSFSGTSGKF